MQKEQRVVFLVTKEVKIPAGYQHPCFKAYTTELQEAESMVIVVGDMEILTLNDNLSEERQQEIIREYWLDHILFTRIEEISEDLVHDPEYEETSNKYQQLYKAIQNENNPEMIRKLIYDLDSVVGDLTAKESISYYLKGLEDGLKAGGVMNG